MKRSIAVIVMFLLMFTISGVHRSFAAPATSPTNSEIVEVYAGNSNDNHRDDNPFGSHCAYNSAVHGTCAVSCIMLAGYTCFTPTFKAEILLPLIEQSGDGLNITPLRRPPKISL